MKKIFNYLAVMLLLVTGFTACDTEPEENVDLAGYYTLSTGFTSAADGAEYAILFNNDTVKGMVYVDRNAPAGTLTVYEKGTSEAVYSEELNLTENTTVTFIKFGGIVDTYSEEKYTTFIMDVKWSTYDEADKYEVTFNGSKLDARGGANYLLRDDLTGNLQIKRIEEGDVVLDREVTIEPEGAITLLQLSATEFLSMPADDETDPESDDYKKVRVYYTLTNELTEESYMIKFYAFDSWVYDMSQAVEIEGAEFEIRAGEISPYFTVYGRTFEMITAGPTYPTYDLIAKDGTVVRTHDPNKIQIAFDHDINWDVDYFKYLNKFETYNINGGGRATLVLSTKW